MKRREAILRVGPAIVLSAMLVFPAVASAVISTTYYQFSATSDVLVTEVQTSTKNGAGNEFVELYNNTSGDIDLADTAHAGKDAWKLQYFSKSKLAGLLPNSSLANAWTSPFRTIALTGTIAAGDYYVLAADSYIPGNIEPDQTYSSTLSDDGGAVQLIDSVTTGTDTEITVHDRLAWSTDTSLAANALLYGSPGSGPSLQRLPNVDSVYTNQDGSLTSFMVATDISPKNAWVAPVTADPTPSQPDPSQSASGSADQTGQAAGGTTAPPAVTSNDGLTPPVITELLPNPATPQTDEINEYIELYNPNDSSFNLKGYTLETGSTTLHDFTFTSDTLLEPHSYQPFYSAETRLSLSNTAGQARLLDPSGKTLYETAAYTTASDGMAWAMDEIDAGWKWTTALTPGAANLILAPAVATKVSTVKPTARTAAKKTVAKVKGANTTKSKKVGAPKRATKPKAKLVSGTSATSAVRQPAPIHAGLLAAVALAAVGYVVYEYRHDLANRIYQFRSNRAARRALRK